MSIFEQPTPSEVSSETEHDTKEAGTQNIDLENKEVENLSPENKETQDTEDNKDGLIFGKYETMEKAEAAFRNITKAFTLKSQELSKVKKSGNLENVDGEKPSGKEHGLTPEGFEDAPDEVKEKFWELLEKNPIAAMNYYAQQAVEAALAPERQTKVLEARHTNMVNILKDYPQVGETDESAAAFSERVAEIALELGRPDLIDNPTPRMLRLAAQELYGNNTEKAYRAAKEAAKEELKNTQTKIGQTTKPSTENKKSSDENLSPEDAIRAGIRAAAKHSGIFRG